jgi:hypothetical protein
MLVLGSHIYQCAFVRGEWLKLNFVLVARLLEGWDISSSLMLMSMFKQWQSNIL